MRSVYSTLLFLAAATPLLADEQSDCLAQASSTNGVIYWTGDEVHLDKADSYNNIVPGSSGTTKGCMQLGQWDGQIKIGVSPDPKKDSRTIIETNPVGEWATYDVSYILGYSHPVICQDTVLKVLTGDNMDLWNVTGASCEDQNGDTCVGPVGPYGKYYPMMSPTSCWNCNPPNAFFAPVAGAAYTFPDDNGAVISGSSNSIACCVGKDCPLKNPKAGSTKNGNCDKNPCTPTPGAEMNQLDNKHKRHFHGHGIHKARGLSEVL